jgi:Uma2 family endonuclease
MSLDAFLAWEATQEVRHEFVGGEVFAMAGGTNVHAHIGANLSIALRRQVFRRGCVLFLADAQLQAGEHVFYPDIIVACGPDALEGSQTRRPTLLAEVLSPGTENYDRGLKWRRYQTHLPSLRTYLPVAQDAIAVDVYRRSDSGWIYSTPLSAGFCARSPLRRAFIFRRPRSRVRSWVRVSCSRLRSGSALVVAVGVARTARPAR